MSVYVDDMLRPAQLSGRPAKWSHLFADTTEELLAAARVLGLREEWLQYPGTHREHFDITATNRARILDLGAEAITYPRGTAALLERRRRVCRCRRLDECRWSVREGSTP